jgi:hypothetical protein
MVNTITQTVEKTEKDAKLHYIDKNGKTKTERKRRKKRW